MNEFLMEKTKIAAYFLWEETKHDHPLNHWYCAEDIACFLEESLVFDAATIEGIVRRGVYDISYIQFIRHIAYRIYVYTNQTDADTNWFAAERLVANAEWCAAVTDMSKTYNMEKDSSDFLRSIRSDKVRSFYNP